MARHVYSILCRRAVVDKDGGQISFHEGIERLNFERIPGSDSRKLDELKASGEGLAIPGGMQLVSWWVRSDYAVPEVAAYRVLFVTPDEQANVLQGLPATGTPTDTPHHELPIDLSANTGLRRIIRLGGIPRWGGFGLYWFVIELDHGEGEWVEVTRIPLEVLMASEPEPEQVAATEDRHT